MCVFVRTSAPKDGQYKSQNFILILIYPTGNIKQCLFIVKQFLTFK